MTIIRNAREDEAAILAGIGLRAWESALAGWADASEMRSSAENAFVSFTQNHWLSIDVAEKGGQAIAWAAREKLDNIITDLWVDPIFQRMGTGSMLLNLLEIEVRDLSYDEILIETHSENTIAIDFLKKHGYAIRSLTTTWSAKLDRDVDTVGLVKLFDLKGDGTYGLS